MFNGIRLSDGDSTYAKRPRRFGKALGWISAMLIVVLIASHGTWSLMESRKLDERIAAIRATGEPLLPTDFASSLTVDPDSDIAHITTAGEMLKQDDEVWKDFDNLEIRLPLRPEEVKAMQAIVDRSGGVLDELKIAQTKLPGAWPMDLSDDAKLIDNLLPTNLGKMRALARFLRCSALLDHHRGNDATVLPRAQQIIFLATAVDRQPSMVGHLVAIGTRALAADMLNDIAPDLKIGNGPNDASPEQMRQIIQALLADQPMRDGFRHAFLGERMLGLAMIRATLSGVDYRQGPRPPKNSRWNVLTRFAMKPLVNHSALLLLNYESAVIPLGEQPNWPTAQQKMPQPVSGNSPATMFARILTPSLNRAVETHFRAIGEQRLAATKLAIRWYAIDHNGQLPQKLDDLVPKYLPSIPDDALANGKPIVYLPDATDPKIYSVGENGTDEGGSEASTNPRHKTPNSEWEMQDRVIHLMRQPRPAPEPDLDAPEAPSVNLPPTTQP